MRTRGAFVVAALAISAFAAPGAAAQTSATAYTCSSTAPTKEFSDSHCTTKPGSSFGHVEIPVGTRTKKGLDATTPVVLKWTTGGVAVSITATSVEVEEAAVGVPAFIENLAGPPMEAFGEGRIKFLGVTANHFCLVNGAASATLTTNRLKTRTLSPTELKIEPAGGAPFISFTFSSCAIAALNRTWTVEGSGAVGTINGATVTFTHSAVTSQATTKMSPGNILAGLEGTLVITGENGDPISFT